MTKKINIEKREDAVIKNFIQNSGWEILKKVDIPNEFERAILYVNAGVNLEKENQNDF